MQRLEHRASPLSSMMPATLADERRGASSRRVSGIAVPYGSQANISQTFLEQFAPDAFAQEEAAGWPQVQLRFQHVDSFLLATTASQTLQLTNDPSGLLYSAELPRSLGYVEELVQRGDIGGASVGFIVARDEWTQPETVGDLPLRTIRSAILQEISLVGNPAYTATTATLRGAPTQRQLDDDVYDDDLGDEVYQSEVLLPSGAKAVLTVDGPLKTLELPDGRQVKMMSSPSMKVMSKMGQATPTLLAAPKRQQQRRQIPVKPSGSMTQEDGRRRVVERGERYDAERAFDREMKTRRHELTQRGYDGDRLAREVAGIR